MDLVVFRQEGQQRNRSVVVAYRTVVVLRMFPVVMVLFARHNVLQDEIHEAYGMMLLIVVPVMCDKIRDDRYYMRCFHWDGYLNDQQEQKYFTENSHKPKSIKKYCCFYEIRQIITGIREVSAWLHSLRSSGHPR